MPGGSPLGKEKGFRIPLMRGRCAAWRCLAACLAAAGLLGLAAPAFGTMLEAEGDAPLYGQNAQVLATVPKGAQVELLATRDVWCRVRYTPAQGRPIEGWSRTASFRKLAEQVEALRDTVLLDRQRREILTLHQGDRAELLEVQAIHLRVLVEVPNGEPAEGLVIKADMIDARTADLARQVKDGFEGLVRVRHAAGFEQRRPKTFGKEKTVVEIVSRKETVWLDVVLASRTPVTGVQVDYQIFKEVSDQSGQSSIVEAKSGVLRPRGQVDSRSVTLPTQFVTFAWEDQIVGPDQPAVGKTLPNLRVGEHYHGYRVQVFWRGFLLALFEENAPPVQQG
ncbi:MAG: hypothetical protein JW889_08280 [Verrucomicrobia bacterium]|nr:hypothetical protein [Verrucomicrobiota bacterium]